MHTSAFCFPVLCCSTGLLVCIPRETFDFFTSGLGKIDLSILPAGTVCIPVVTMSGFLDASRSSFR